MNVKKLFLPMVGLVGALMLPLVAQAQAPKPTTHSVYQRLHNQRARIRRGVRSHALSHHAAVRLTRHVARIQRVAARDRYTHGGRLTHAERTRLNTRLNKTNTSIYNRAHKM